MEREMHRRNFIKVHQYHYIIRMPHAFKCYFHFHVVLLILLADTEYFIYTNLSLLLPWHFNCFTLYILCYGRISILFKCTLYFEHIIHLTIQSKGPLLLWSYDSWIYNYLCNQCLSPLTLWVRISLMARCTRYNIML